MSIEWTGSPLSASQILMVGSQELEASRRPSGLHTRLLVSSSGTWIASSFGKALGSQTRTDPSSPAEASRRLSGLHVTATTRPICPSRICRADGLAGFQTRTV